MQLPPVFSEGWLASVAPRALGCAISEVLKLIAALPAKSTLQMQHILCSGDSSDTADPSLCALEAVHAMLPSLQQLCILGLHGVKLRTKYTKYVRVLSGIICRLRSSLMGITVSLSDWSSSAEDLMEKVGCVGPLYMLENLKLLALPQWQKLLASREAVSRAFRKLGQLTVLIFEDGGIALATAAAVTPLELHFSTVLALYSCHRVRVTKRRIGLACIGNPKLEQETREGTHAQETPAYQRRPTTLHEVQGSNPPTRALYMQLAIVPHTHQTTPYNGMHQSYVLLQTGETSIHAALSASSSCFKFLCRSDRELQLMRR